MDFENNTITIPFHWSGEVWAITIIILIIFVGTGFHITLSNWPTAMLWLKYLLTVTILTTVIVGVGYMPIRLKANDEKITVSRLFGALEMPLSEVIETRRISKSEMNGSIRTFGSGGLFGYLGRFKNNRLGHYSMYATEWNNLILVRTSNKKYVFSCSHPQKFVEFVNLKLKQ